MCGRCSDCGVADSLARHCRVERLGIGLSFCMCSRAYFEERLTRVSLCIRGTRAGSAQRNYHVHICVQPEEVISAFSVFNSLEQIEIRLTVINIFI